MRTYSITAVIFMALLCGMLYPVSAVTVGFSSAEGYSDGGLNNNALWVAHSNAVVDTSGSARVSVPAYNEATFQAGEVVQTGGVYRCSIDFSFTEANDSHASAAAFKDLLNISYSAASTPGEMLKIGLRRNYPGFSLTLKTDWKYTDNVAVIAAGSTQSSQISADLLGITRDTNLDSDALRIEVELTRGLNDNDWSVQAYLYNISASSPVEIGELSATGVVFPAPSFVFGGFGGGQSDSNSGVSNRQVDTFRFEAVDNSPPEVEPPAPGTVPADLNQNGIPDLAELLAPAIAQFPPALDSDGDGRSNLEEAQTGTDPFDPLSVFNRSNMAFTGGSQDEIEFSFDSVANVRYRVSYSETLEAGSWIPAGDVTA
ncbi:MAG: thrombospondin type 3 repeat-containing protein, partial [Verrucomicrobiota bacterium]